MRPARFIPLRSHSASLPRLARKPEGEGIGDQQTPIASRISIVAIGFAMFGSGQVTR